MKLAERTDDEPVSRAVVPGHCIQLAGETARVPIPGHSVAEPRIQVIREGDEVRAIEITCSCGQKVRLRCVYDK
jgi:hypothetical protein